MLDDGEIAEFGVPHNLLQDASGHLRKLVDQTGEVEAKRLEEQAFAAMNTNTRNHSDDISDTELELNEPVNRTANANEMTMDVPTIVIEGDGDDVGKPLLGDTGV